MKAIDREFTKIINGTSQLVIPVFQRDYSWSEENCGQLWNDVIRVGAETTERGHFLGSVVYVSTGDSTAGFTRWLLIDGQQRLTTLTLLLIALRDHIVDTGWSGTDDSPTAKRVEAYFLKNVQEEGDRQYKLALRRHDNATLRALLDRSPPPKEASDHIRDNYDFFRDCLLSADPEEVYRGICRLVVVDVTLVSGSDDPQLIFESLNSTGLDLGQSDLIRNYILMRLPEKEQTRLYETYWSKIETLFRGFDKTFDTFVRDYLALRTKASKQERADKIYDAFRREFASIGSDQNKLEELLKELMRFARYYGAFSVGTDAPGPLKEPLSRLHRLVDVPATLIMKLYDCQETSSNFSIGEFAEAIDLIESYVFRRAICGLQTRGYWLEFAKIAYRISAEKPLQSLKVSLARLAENYAFPSNEDFQKALETEDVFHKRVCFHLLDRLENYRSKEITDTSTYTIEHIMPQNEKLSADWKKMLGKNWKEVRRDWLHRLGNLTLTGYNSTYSDRPFEKKKSIKGGFSESSVRLNKFVREQDKWTSQEMSRRGKELAKRALAIWPSLTVDQALVDAENQIEMKERAQRRDVSKVPMTPAARHSFEQLRQRIQALDSEIFELAEQKSVSYHGPTFFLEVIPRKNGLGLLLALYFNEIEEPPSVVRDAAQSKFIVHATYDAGVYARIKLDSDLDKVFPLIKKAYELAKA